MKKIGIALLGTFLLLGTSVFVFFNNQGYCSQDHACNTPSAQGTGIILPYSPQALQEAFSRSHKVALYFQANWCGNCKLLEDELLVKGIPVDSTLLTVDFDAEQELRQRYQVTNLHTLVVVDPAMNLLKKDSSGEYEKIYQLLSD